MKESDSKLVYSTGWAVPRKEKRAGRKSTAPAASGKSRTIVRLFDLKTALSDLDIRGERIYFKAEDVDWKSEYAWRPSDGKLDFKAVSKITGKTVFSKPLKSNVFRR